MFCGGDAVQAVAGTSKEGTTFDAYGEKKKNYVWPSCCLFFNKKKRNNRVNNDNDTTTTTHNTTTTHAKA
jgi:hypothetical protein